ncbi:hypothetical protein [Robbsia sp. KACC 23696]|uniref:hypothetical protein n=1 Tax=Robbsia sp. KACC 23696 TaxID=3149231 RepID=UPI00325AAA7B
MAPWPTRAMTSQPGHAESGTSSNLCVTTTDSSGTLLGPLDGLVPVTDRIAAYLTAGPAPQREMVRRLAAGSSGLRQSLEALSSRRAAAYKRFSDAVSAWRGHNAPVLPMARDTLIDAVARLTSNEEKVTPARWRYVARAVDEWIRDDLLTENVDRYLREFLRHNRLPVARIGGALNDLRHAPHDDSDEEVDEDLDEEGAAAPPTYAQWHDDYSNVLAARNLSHYELQRWFDLLYCAEDSDGRRSSHVAYSVWRRVVLFEQEGARDDDMASERLENHLDAVADTVLPYHFDRALNAAWFETVLFDPVIAPYASSLFAIAERALPQVYDWEQFSVEWVRTLQRSPIFVENLLVAAATLAVLPATPPVLPAEPHYFSLSPLFDRLLLDSSMTEARASTFLRYVSQIQAALRDASASDAAQSIGLLLSGEWSDLLVDSILRDLSATHRTFVLANAENLGRVLQFGRRLYERESGDPG